MISIGILNETQTVQSFAICQHLGYHLISLSLAFLRDLEFSSNATWVMLSSALLAVQLKVGGERQIAG